MNPLWYLGIIKVIVGTRVLPVYQSLFSWCKPSTRHKRTLFLPERIVVRMNRSPDGPRGFERLTMTNITDFMLHDSNSHLMIKSCFATAKSALRYLHLNATPVRKWIPKKLLRVFACWFSDIDLTQMISSPNHGRKHLTVWWKVELGLLGSSIYTDGSDPAWTRPPAL